MVPTAALEPTPTTSVDPAAAVPEPRRRPAAGRRRSPEYDHLTPLLRELAELPARHPRRERLRSDIVAGFRPVALHIAQRFGRRGEPTEDLEQVACLGLVAAVDRFDARRGVDFLSYAIPTITGEVRRHFRDTAWAVRTPRGIKDRYVSVGAAVPTLSQQFGRAPTPGEIGEHLGLGTDEVVEALNAADSYRPTSLDRALSGSEDDDSALLDVLGVGEPEFERTEQREMLGRALEALPERERTIIGLRFYRELTQSQIGEHLQISQMHVSRLLRRTLDQLRDVLERPD